MAHLPWRVGTPGLAKKFVNPNDLIKNWKLVKGDVVEVVTGRDKGARGKILEVQRRWNTMLVEGCRMNKKRAPGPNGEKTYLFEMETPIHYSHVNLIDPKDDLPTQVTYMFNDEGQKVRVSARSLEPIPVPRWRRRDFDSRLEYEEGDQDTSENDLRLKTYFPTTDMTFAEEVMQSFKPQQVWIGPPTVRGRTKADRKHYPRLRRTPMSGEREDALRRDHHGSYGSRPRDGSPVDLRPFDHEETYAEMAAAISNTQAKQLSDWELMQARGGEADPNQDGLRDQTIPKK